jgi:hypothetical protein
MPLYELLCLARPLLARDQLQRMIEKVGGMVYTKGGVVTNVVSYGKQPLAYKITGVQGKFDEVSSDHLSCCVLHCGCSCSKHSPNASICLPSRSVAHDMF